MIETITAANGWLNGYVWGWPMIVLLVGTGLLLTILTGGAQFRYLGVAFREVLGKLTQKSTAAGEVSPFQAVATALASTVGVGNIAGVATAISIGGPGALFWLWVSGILGMCTKFAEIVIAIHYREKDATGQMRGGAMYVLRNGLGLPWLGTIFAGLVALAAFGIGNMVQSNSVASSLQASFGIQPAHQRPGAGGGDRGGHPRRHQAHRPVHRVPGAVHGDVLSRRRAVHPGALRVGDARPRSRWSCRRRSPARPPPAASPGRR